MIETLSPNEAAHANDNGHLREACTDSRDVRGGHISERAVIDSNGDNDAFLPKTRQQFGVLHPVGRGCDDGRCTPEYRMLKRREQSLQNSAATYFLVLGYD